MCGTDLANGIKLTAMLMKIPLRRNKRGGNVISLISLTLNQDSVLLFLCFFVSVLQNHTSHCKDVIVGANTSELYFVACVLIYYLTSVCLIKGSSHTS